VVSFEGRLNINNIEIIIIIIIIIKKKKKKKKKRDRYLEDQKYLAKSSTSAPTQHPSGIRYCTFSLLFRIL